MKNSYDDDKSLIIKIPKDWETYTSDTSGQFIGEVIYERVRYVLKSKQQSEVPLDDQNTGSDTLPSEIDDQDTGSDTLPSEIDDQNTGSDISPSETSGSTSNTDNEEETDMSNNDTQEKYTATDFADAVETLWSEKENRPSRYAICAAFSGIDTTTMTKDEGIKLVNDFMAKEVK